MRRIRFLNLLLIFALVQTVAAEDVARKGACVSPVVGVDDVWKAYDAFNDIMLDRDKFIYKLNSMIYTFTANSF